jgi:hypothetical protein
MGFAQNHTYTVMFNGNIIIDLRQQIFMSDEDEQQKRIKGEFSSKQFKNNNRSIRRRQHSLNELLVKQYDQ